MFIFGKCLFYENAFKFEKYSDFDRISCLKKTPKERTKNK